MKITTNIMKFHECLSVQYKQYKNYQYPMHIHGLFWVNLALKGQIRAAPNKDW